MLFTAAYAGGFNLAGLLGVALMQMLLLVIVPEQQNYLSPA